MLLLRSSCVYFWGALVHRNYVHILLDSIILHAVVGLSNPSYDELRALPITQENPT